MLLDLSSARNSRSAPVTTDTNGIVPSIDNQIDDHRGCVEICTGSAGVRTWRDDAHERHNADRCRGCADVLRECADSWGWPTAGHTSEAGRPFPQKRAVGPDAPLYSRTDTPEPAKQTHGERRADR